MRIDMFVYNRCTTDARVLKEATTLAGVGHDVRVVAILDDTTVPIELRNGFRIVRILRNPIHYRLLRLLRTLTGSARRGGVGMAERVGIEGRRRDVASLLAAPLVLAARLGRLLLRAGLSTLRGFEAAVRRGLLAPHKPLMFLDYYRRAYRLVRADPPDALHAHDLNTLPVAAALAWRLRLQLVYDAHELYPEISTLSSREAAIWRFIERLLARRATRIVTVCDSIAEEIEQRNGVDRPLVVLNCPLAVGAVAEPASLHELVGLPPAEPIVLYQGGFAPHRGLATTILAALHLSRGTLVLMGWGRLEEELRSLIAHEGLEGRVLIAGPVPPEQVVAFAAAAAVGVIPYEPVGLNNTYTTPNKLFDYMAAGLPIVASRLPELVRFVHGNEIGATFEPGDPEALAAAVDGILADKESSLAMRARALAAAKRYSWEHEAEKLVAIYGEVTVPGISPTG